MGPFTLAQLARAVGMSVDDVRFYRDSGLLPPPRRTRSRTDDSAFGAVHVERLRLIKRAVGYGFSVEDIGKMVGDTGLTTCNDVYRIAAQRLEQLRCDRDNVRASSLKALIGTCAQRGSGGTAESSSPSPSPIRKSRGLPKNPPPAARAGGQSGRKRPRRHLAGRVRDRSALRLRRRPETGRTTTYRLG